MPPYPDRANYRISRNPDRRMERKIEDTLSVLAVTGAVHRTETGWLAPRRHP